MRLKKGISQLRAKSDRYSVKTFFWGGEILKSGENNGSISNCRTADQKYAQRVCARSRTLLINIRNFEIIHNLC